MAHCCLLERIERKRKQTHCKPISKKKNKNKVTHTKNIRQTTVEKSSAKKCEEENELSNQQFERLSTTCVNKCGIESLIPAPRKKKIIWKRRIDKTGK